MSTTIAELLVEIGVSVEDADKASKTIEGLKDETKDLGKKADTADKKTRSFGKGLAKGLAVGAAAAAAAITAAASAIFNFVNETTAGIDATVKLGRALGVPVEELQKLQFAAERSGVAAEKLKAATLKLNTAMGDLSEAKAGPAAEALGDLGLKFADLEGLTTTDKLGLIGERIQELGTATEKSALSAKIFGEEAGPALASLLAEGRDGLAALGDQAKNVFTEEDGARAEAFQDAMTNLTSTLEGIAQTVALELLPPVMEVIQTFQSWVDSSDSLIGTGIDVFLTILGDIFNAVQSEVQLLVAIFRPLISFVIDLGRRIDGVVPIFSVFRRIITALFNPLNTLIDIVETVIFGMEKLGLVSEGTSARFGAAVDRMVADSAGFELIGQRADDAGGAVSDLNAETENAKDEAGNPISTGAPTSPEQQDRNQQRERRRQERSARRGVRTAKNTGAGGAGAKKEPKKEVKSNVTFGEVLARLGSGDPSALAEDIKGIAAKTPETRDIQPTVAVTFMQFIFQSGAFDIKSTDPLGSAKEVGGALATALQKAGDGMNSPVIR